MAELEERLMSLQEEMRLKDEIMFENEKKIEESYGLKYELADLKDKCSELESALQDRDNYIIQLEETKQFLAK